MEFFILLIMLLKDVYHIHVQISLSFSSRDISGCRLTCYTSPCCRFYNVYDDATKIHTSPELIAILARLEKI